MPGFPEFEPVFDPEISRSGVISAPEAFAIEEKFSGEQSDQRLCLPAQRTISFILILIIFSIYVNILLSDSQHNHIFYMFYLTTLIC